jgi:hypothetical protein
MSIGSSLEDSWQSVGERFVSFWSAQWSEGCWSQVPRSQSQAAANKNSELVAQFQMPHLNVSHRVFVAAVRGLLGKAEEQKDLLVSHGMQPSLLDDLEAAVVELEKTLEGRPPKAA